MKILITGGCGFVGSNIAIFLKKKLKHAEICSVDNLYRKGSILNKKRLNKFGIQNFKVDIKDYKKISSLKKFNLVIDCCAEPAIEASLKDPDRVFNTNLVGTYNILKKSEKDSSNIIFLSSSRVYSISKLRSLLNNLNLKKPIRIKKKINEKFENSSPSSLYGFTKFSSEKLIKEFSFVTNIKYLINRLGVIAGPWQFGKQDQGFVTLWIAKHLFKKKLSYIGFGGNGHQVRDIIHIDDVCEIVYIQIKKFNKIYNETFNIGGGLKNSISLKELTMKAQSITGNHIKIGRINKTSKFDIPYYISDNSRIKKFYKWSPSKNIDTILKDILRWLKNDIKINKFFK